MGLMLWIVVGTSIAVVGKVAASSPRWPFGSPSLLVTLGGAVVGGFLVDLAVRGDSVMHFKGPTLIGAIVGSLVVWALASLVSRQTPSSGRS